MTLTWFSALSIGLAADVFVAIGMVLLVRADRRYQAAKKAQLQAMGLYGPKFVDQPVIVPAEVTVFEPALAEPEPAQPQGMGLYGPEFVSRPVVMPAKVIVLEPAPAAPEPALLPIIPEVRAITAGWVGGE